MSDIFISYARDERDRAQLVKDHLDWLGLDVFFDVDGGIDAGDSFPQRITDAVKTSKVVLACWSKLALGKDWVRRECMMARDLDKLVAIAVHPVSKLDFPAEFYDVNCEDASDFSGQDKHTGWSQCLASIAGRLEKWIEAHPGAADANATRTKVYQLRSASAAKRLEGPVGRDRLSAIANAAASWAAIKDLADPSTLHNFADSVPGTKESSIARARAISIDEQWRRLADFQWSALSAFVADGSRERLAADFAKLCQECPLLSEEDRSLGNGVAVTANNYARLLDSILRLWEDREEDRDRLEARLKRAVAAVVVLAALLALSVASNVWVMSSG